MKIVSFFLKTLLLCMLISVVYSNTWRIHSLVVFGGADSDNGRSFDLYKIPTAPYWHGRFSNGPAWDEYLAYKLHLIPNPRKNPNYNKRKLFLAYTYYSATATRKYNTDPNYLMSLDDEVRQYAANPRPHPHGTLVAVYAGENDLFDEKCANDPLTCLQDVTDAEKSAMLRLCKLRIKHFLVITPGDQADMPYYVRFYKYKDRQKLLQLEASYLRSFADLKKTIESQCPKSQVLVFFLLDYESTWMKNFNQPTHIPCYWNVDNQGNLIYNKQIGPVCSNPNKYYYFDSFYGTEASNKLMANAVYKEIIKNKWEKPPAKHWWQKII